MIQIYKEQICGIYSIENTINNKKYIGQSVDIKSRWCHHRADLNNGIHTNDYLQHSWNKYGESSFEFKLLEECSKDNLNDRERYYIDLYDTLNEDCGYNLKSGGQDKNFVTDYVKQKISKANIKYYEEHPEAKLQSSINAYKQWSNPKIKTKIMGKIMACMVRRILLMRKRKLAKLKKVAFQNIEIQLLFYVWN